MSPLIVYLHNAPNATPTRNVTAFRYDGSEAWTANLTGDVAKIAATADGGVLVFHTLYTNHGDNNHEINVWLTKLNNRGNILWTHEIYHWEGGMSGLTQVPIFRDNGGIVVNSDGEIFVAPGYFFPYPDPNPGGLGSPGDIFMVKFDSNGNHLFDYSWTDFAFGTKNIPRYLRMDSDENMWLGPLNNGDICVFDGEGQFLRDYTGGSSTYDIDVSMDQGVFAEARLASPTTDIMRVRSVSDGSTLWSMTPNDLAGYSLSLSSVRAESVAYDPSSGKVFLGTTSDIPPSTPPSNESQRITITGATGGTFTLSYKDKVTSPLAYNATASNVRVAIHNLGYGINTSAGSGGPLGTSPVTISFAYDAEVMQLDTSGLEGDTITATLEVTSSGTSRRRLFSVIAAGSSGAVQESAQIIANKLVLNGNGVLAVAGQAMYSSGSIAKFDTTLNLDWERYPFRGNTTAATDTAFEVAFTPRV